MYSGDIQKIAEAYQSGTNVPITEASVQAQRALMKEIIRRREAGAQPMSAAEKEELISKHEAPQGKPEYWIFGGLSRMHLLKRLLKASREWVEEGGGVGGETTYRLPVPMEANQASINQVMRSYLIPEFEKITRKISEAYCKFSPAIAKLNGGLDIGADRLQKEETIIELETTPHHRDIDGASWYSVTSPSIYHIQIESTYSIQPPTNPRTLIPRCDVLAVKSVLRGTFYIGTLSESNLLNTIITNNIRAAYCNADSFVPGYSIREERTYGKI